MLLGSAATAALSTAAIISIAAAASEVDIVASYDEPAASDDAAAGGSVVTAEDVSIATADAENANGADGAASVGISASDGDNSRTRLRTYIMPRIILAPADNEDRSSWQYANSASAIRYIPSPVPAPGSSALGSLASAIEASANIAKANLSLALSPPPATNIGTTSLRFWGCSLLVLKNPRKITEHGLMKQVRLFKA